MAKKITLDTVRESIEKTFESTIFEGFGLEMELMNPMRLSDADRSTLIDLTSDWKDKTEEEVFQTVDQILTLVAKDKAIAKKYLAAAAKDAEGKLIKMQIINLYFEELHVGEASPSES